MIGKFALSLDPEYTIGVEVDGTFDGVSSTQLVIGRSSKENTSLVSLALNDYVRIEAYPSKGFGTRDQFITSDTSIQAGFAKETKAKVSGVEARLFVLDGVGENRKYYFENDGITYLIEAWDLSMGDNQVMLEAVLSGFSFK